MLCFGKWKFLQTKKGCLVRAGQDAASLALFAPVRYWESIRRNFTALRSPPPVSCPVDPAFACSSMFFIPGNYDYRYPQ